jgi:hypothetical protein
MSRIITVERRRQIAHARTLDPDALGPILGELVVEGNVPVKLVATLLDVANVTVYRWMYGAVQPRDPTTLQRLRRLVTVLRKAKRANDLPLAGDDGQRTAQMKNLLVAHRPPPRPE